MTGATAVLALALAAPGQAEEPKPPSPVSLFGVSIERIRDGLQQPPTIAITIPPLFDDAVPRFRARVDALFDNPLAGMRKELALSSGYTGGSGIDVLPLAMGVVKKIQAARRARAEADARKDVAEAVAAFCAAHDCSLVESGPQALEGILLPPRRRE